MADNAPKTFEDLSADVMAEVAKYCDSHVLTHSLAPVNKFCHDVANDAYVWSAITVVPCCLKELLHIAKKHPSITKVNCPFTYEVPIAELIALLPNLRRLDCTTFTEWPADHGLQLTYAKTLNAALGAGASVTQLDIMPEFLGSLDDLAAACPNVTKLLVDSFGKNDAVDSLWPAFPELRAVLFRSFSGVPVTADSWQVFVEAHPSLVQLRLGSLNLAQTAAVEASFPLLEVLTSTATDAEHVKVINSIINSAPALTTYGTWIVSASTLEALGNRGIKKFHTYGVNTDEPDNEMEAAITQFADNNNLETIKGDCPEKFLPFFLGAVTNATEISKEFACQPLIVGLGEGVANLRHLEISKAFDLDACQILGQHATNLRYLKLSAAAFSEECLQALSGCAVNVREAEFQNGGDAVAAVAGASGLCRRIKFHNAPKTVAAFFNATPDGMFLESAVLRRVEEDSLAALADFATRGGRVSVLTFRRPREIETYESAPYDLAALCGHAATF